LRDATPYLKEEIAAEGLTRNLPAFASFLHAAALSDAALVNYTNIARDCGVSANAVREYFQILVDSLLGRFLPAYTRRPKRRVIQGPKFYFADVGVVNHLAHRGPLTRGGELFGKALENLVHHELTAFCEYHERTWDLAYWRLASGVEVDFVVAASGITAAIEVKSTEHVADHHLTGLRAIAVDHRTIGSRVLVCLERKRRVTADGIEILPVSVFLQRLWTGTVV
jgi:predicted AAA+ superfamily ATPase